MNETNFCYWLQGYSEICGQTPTEAQWNIIKEHLKLVFETIKDETMDLKNFEFPSSTFTSNTNKLGLDNWEPIRTDITC